MSAVAAFSTLGCGELSIDDALALASSRGMGAIELRSLGGTNDILGYLNKRFSSPADFAAFVEESGIVIASFDTSVQAIYTPAADRVWLVEALPWIIASRAPRIRVFDGGKDGSNAELDSAGALIDWWNGVAVAAGCTAEMAVETHDALARPEALQRFLDRVPAAQILWDTYHTWNEGGEGPERTWQRLRGRTSHLHVKDSRAAGDGVIQYVPPGQGDYPFDALLGVLAAAEFCGVVSLEWERFWFPELPSIDDALDGYERVFLPLFSPQISRTEFVP